MAASANGYRWRHQNAPTSPQFLTTKACQVLLRKPPGQKVERVEGRMQTLINALRKNAEHTEKGIVFVRSDGGKRGSSIGQTWRRALERACFLRDRGIKKGDRIVLALPEPDDFVLTFFGALVAGAVPVPLYPPQTLARLDAYL